MAPADPPPHLTGQFRHVQKQVFALPIPFVLLPSDVDVHKDVFDIEWPNSWPQAAAHQIFLTDAPTRQGQVGQRLIQGEAIQEPLQLADGDGLRRSVACCWPDELATFEPTVIEPLSRSFSYPEVAICTPELPALAHLSCRNFGITVIAIHRA